jgi:DNA (cytosine-5)-methyltransferase 1
LKLPKITLDFNEKPITFGEIRTNKGLQPAIKPESRTGKIWSMRKPSDIHFAEIMQRNYGKDSFFNHILVSDNKVMATIASASTFYLQDSPFHVSSDDLITVQTFPHDFDFGKHSYSNIKYVFGMSVPPLMTAGIAKEIEKQLLKSVAK